MKPKILVLGAGFGGLELSTLLSQSFGDSVDITLIDKSDHFMFGFSKLDVMFGRETAQSQRLYYRNFAKPGVRYFLVGLAIAVLVLAVATMLTLPHPPA